MNNTSDIDMKAIILKSYPMAQFHFGTATLELDSNLGDSSANCHSDTIWSAIVDNCFKIDKKSALELIDWSENGRIKISSAFFCLYNNGNLIYFFQKPISLNLSNVDPKLRKKVKKIKYLSKGVLEMGMRPNDWFFGPCVIIQDEFVARIDEIKDPSEHLYIYNISSFPKTRVSYKEETGNFYHQTNLQLFNNVSYFFLIDHNLNDSEWNQFQKYLDLTFSFGLGGELSTGCGQIHDYQIRDFELNLNNSQNNQYISCSLTILPDYEIDNALCYSVVTRGGRKLIDGSNAKLIDMIEEGAVFNSVINGSIVDLKPDEYATPVKRCGTALLLPLHKNFWHEKEADNES